jgi:aminopeptidase-like protein
MGHGEIMTLAATQYDEDHLDRMLQLIESISPLQRMINSQGLDKTFDILSKAYSGIIIHEYKTGEICGDWEVPPAWKVSEAFLKNKKGNILASFKSDPLFVAPYSEPIDAWFNKEEIEKHLRTNKDRPNAFLLEHRNAYDYNLVDWGITLPYNLWKTLPDDSYHIKIEVLKTESSMKVGELFLQGETDTIICLNAHIDELCNDDLSGCIVALELMRYLEKLPNRKFSYQAIVSPELLGTLFYIDRNMNKVKRTFGIVNLETVGAGEELCVKRTLGGKHILDKIMTLAVKSVGTQFKEIQQFEGYGNDEHVFAWPGIGVPGIALQYHPFYEYHTSFDTPNIIQPDLMMTVFGIMIEFFKILETNYIPKIKNGVPPYLSKRNLYIDRTRDPENHSKYNRHLLFSIDGKCSLVEICENLELPYFSVVEYLQKFCDQDLIDARNWSPHQLVETLTD